MSEINQGYFDRVRFILQNESLGSLIIDEPIGWNTDNKELARHKDYHGIFPKFSNNLKFIGSAYDYLKTCYEVFGINADVRLIKDERHSRTDEWTRSYDGYLDMSTYKLSNNKIDLKFNSGGLEMELKARESEAVEITRTTTLDGLPLTDLPINQVELDGRRIFLKSIWKNDEGMNKVTLDVTSNGGGTRRITTGYPLKIINRSHEEAHSIIYASNGNEIVGSTGMMAFINGNRVRNLVIKGEGIKFKPIITSPWLPPFTDIDWGIISVCLTVFENGIDYNVKNREYLFSSQTLPGDTFNQLLLTNNILRELNFERTINLQQNESIALELFIESDLASGNNKHFRVDFTEFDGLFTIEEDSFFEKSIANCVLPFELAERLIEIYTNKKALKSNVLGRTDIGYSQDGKASLIGQSHGLWIRNFSDEDKVFKPLTTSLKDFMKSFQAMYNLGLGIENDGFKEFVRIEELGYFYNRNTTIKLPNQVKNVERTIAADYYYSSLELGFEKGGDYEEAFGLVEYNGSSKFSTTIKRIKNTYSKLSKYRGDSYGAEFARRKPKLTHGTEDTRYDSDVFSFDMKRGENTLFKLRKWQDDFEQAPTGTFSPETAYNLRLSPFNCLLRHGWVVASGLTKYLSDYVRYTSSSANSSLSTKLRTDSNYLLDPLHSVANGNEYAENGNIINLELGRPRFVPEFVGFEHEVTFEINQLLMGSKTILGKKIPNIYGCIEFTNENGEQEKGFLMNLKPNGKGNWRVLKAN